MQLVRPLNVVEPSTEEPMKVERWFRRPRRITLQRENEVLRRQLDEQSRELADQSSALAQQAKKLAQQGEELARFGSLRDRVGTMEPALRDAVIEGMSQQAAVAESALAADLQDALDMSSFEMDSLAAARGSARRLVETALALGEEKKSSNER